MTREGLLGAFFRKKLVQSRRARPGCCPGGQAVLLSSLEALGTLEGASADAGRALSATVDKGPDSTSGERVPYPLAIGSLHVRTCMRVFSLSGTDLEILR